MLTKTSKEDSLYVAYKTIDEFFDSYSIHNAVRQIQDVIKAATDNQPYKMGQAYDVVFLLENLSALYRAALVIGNEKEKKVIINARENGYPQMTQLQYYVSTNHANNQWNCFPRYLTAEQYFNPYKAIQEAFVEIPIDNWDSVLKEIQRYALSDEPIDLEQSSYNVLCIQLGLQLLVEACHLLYVRLRLERKQKEE